MTMQRRALGRSDLLVSEFALGAMTFGMDTWGCDEATAHQLVDRYLEAGGNVIDTASGYGRSEEILGRILSGRRNDIVVATKFGMPIGRGPDDRGASRTHIMRAIEQSLQRLQTDYIDLYQLHVDHLATPLDETLTTLDELVRSGTVRHIGASNMRAYRLMKALDLSDQRGLARFVSFQGQYNLIVRSLEREHVPLFAEEGLGLISWSPLAAGMLTGKISRDHKPSDTRLGQRETAFESMFVHERGFEIADVVQQVAAEMGCSSAELALAWQRTRPVASVIIGVRTMEQLESNLRALEIDIPGTLLARLDEVSRLADEYPATFVDLFQEIFEGGRALSQTTRSQPERSSSPL